MYRQSSHIKHLRRAVVTIINFHLQRGSQHRGNLPSTPSIWSPKCDTCRESQGHSVYCDKLQTERKTALTQLSLNEWGFGFNMTWLSTQNGGPGSHCETRSTTASLTVWWSKTACIKTVWVDEGHIFSHIVALLFNRHSSHNLTSLKTDIVFYCVMQLMRHISYRVTCTEPATSLLFHSVQEPERANFDCSLPVLYHFQSVGSPVLEVWGSLKPE